MPFTDGMKCPKCESDDNIHMVETKTMLGMEIIAEMVKCHACGYIKRELRVNGKTVFLDEGK